MLRAILAGLSVCLAFLGGVVSATAQDGGGAAPAATASHVALVISNGRYAKGGEATLADADGDAVAKALAGLGYEVERRKDLDFASFRKSLIAFQDRASRAGGAVIYYSGYGMTVDGTGYVLPVDAVLSSAETAEFEAIPVDLVLRAAAGGAGMRLVVLDAFRSNPFVEAAAPSSRTVASGLPAVAPAAADMMVAYPAEPGTATVAATGQNSPYVEAIVARATEPGIDLATLFLGVGEAVKTATAGGQVPVTYGSVAPARGFVAPAPEPTAATSGTGASCQFAEAHWNNALAMNQQPFFEEHLQLFGTCPFASFARAKLAELRTADAAGAEPAAKETAKKPVLRKKTAAKRTVRKRQTKQSVEESRRRTNVFDPACRGNTGFGMCK